MMIRPGETIAVSCFVNQLFFHKSR